VVILVARKLPAELVTLGEATCEVACRGSGSTKDCIARNNKSKPQTGFFALNHVIWFSFKLKKHKQGYYKTTAIQDHMKSARNAKYKC
jgi:hypothetical protein